MATPEEKAAAMKLVSLLFEVERLGLNFERGRASILAGYVKEQERLKAEISEATKAAALLFSDE